MAVSKGKQYYSSGEEKGKIMLDRFKVAKVPICQCGFSIEVTAYNFLGHLTNKQVPMGKNI